MQKTFYSLFMGLCFSFVMSGLSGCGSNTSTPPIPTKSTASGSITTDSTGTVTAATTVKTPSGNTMTIPARNGINHRWYHPGCRSNRHNSELLDQRVGSAGCCPYSADRHNDGRIPRYRHGNSEIFLKGCNCQDERKFRGSCCRRYGGDLQFQFGFMAGG